jgi:hypothetical protein
MIPKSESRFSGKIMVKEDKASTPILPGWTRL